ncbi:hypothetical protein AAMO2058_000458500 [Amorphochlora amoebiformis]
MPLSTRERPSGVFERYKPSLKRKRTTINYQKEDKIARSIKSRAEPEPEKEEQQEEQVEVVETTEEVDAPPSIKSQNKKTITKIVTDEDGNEYEEEYEEVVVAIDENGNEVEYEEEYEEEEELPSNFRVLIRNLDKEVNATDLAVDLFQDQESLEEGLVSIALHAFEDGTSRGTSEAIFRTKNQCKACVRYLDGAEYRGKVLKAMMIVNETKGETKARVRPKPRRKKVIASKSKKVTKRLSTKPRTASNRALTKAVVKGGRRVKIRSAEPKRSEVSFAITDAKGAARGIGLKKKKSLVLSKPGGEPIKGSKGRKKAISIKGGKKSISLKRKMGASVGKRNLSIKKGKAKGISIRSKKMDEDAPEYDLDMQITVRQ